MKRLQAFRYELMPSNQQERKMRQFAGSARYVFNKALGIQNAEREQTGRKQSGYAALCRMLTGWRSDPETIWLADAPVHTTQQSLRNLEAAWARHFESLEKRRRGEIRPDEVVEPPRFKKKNTARQSFRYPDPKQFRIEQGNNRLFLPKLGWVRYRNSRALEGQPSNLTVSREGHKWFVSVQTEREVKQPVHPSSSIVGIDLGVVRFATLSNGEVIPPAHSFERKEKRLKRYQHRMARRTGAPSPTAKYEPPVSGLWTYLRRKPHDTSRLPVCAVRLHGRRGFRGSYQYSFSRSRALAGQRAGHGRRFCRAGNRSPDRL